MKDEIVKKVTKVVKKAVKAIFAPILMGVGIFAIIFIILAGSLYWLTVDDGTYKEDDWESTTFSAKSYTNSVKVNDDGSVSSETSSNDLWNKMLDNGSRVNLYLDNERELRKLMNAEVCTQYPDTRQNPDEEIDWDKLTEEDDANIQGIIKFKRNILEGVTKVTSEELEELKNDYELYQDNYEMRKKEAEKAQERKKEEKTRKNKIEEDNREFFDNIDSEEETEANSDEGFSEELKNFDEWMENQGYRKKSEDNWERDGSKITMTYVKPSTFQSYIDEYRRTGSEEAKNKALCHFTIEQGESVETNDVQKAKSLDGFLFLGDSITEGLKEAVEKETESLNQTNRDSLKNVIFRAKKNETPRGWIDNFNLLPESKDVKGVCVLLGINAVNDTSSMKELINKLSIQYSNKNIYVQKIFPVGNNYEEKYMTKEEMNENVKKYNAEIEEYCNTLDNVFCIETRTGYITDSEMLDPNSTRDGLHLTQYDKWIENIIQQVVDNDADSKEEKEQENEGANETESVEGKEITTTPNLEGQAYKEPLNPYCPDYKGECTWFAWGRFYEIYGYSPGFTGSGKECVDQLLEAWPEKFKKSDTPAIGAIFSCQQGGDATRSAGHVGVVIGWDGTNITIDEGNYLGQPWARHTYSWEQFKTSIYPSGLTFAVPNNEPSVGVVSKNTASASKYYVKVATWTETQETYTTNDPDDTTQNYNNVLYNMDTTNINFYDMVKSYTMPFDYLWALLTITEDKDFIFDLVELVNNSRIEITVNDNLQVTKTTTVNTYDVKTTQTTKGNVTVTYEEEVKGDDFVGPVPSGNKQDTVVVNRIVSGDVDAVNEPTPLSYGNTKVTIVKNNVLDIALTRANVWIIDLNKTYKYKRVEPVKTGGEKVKLPNGDIATTQDTADAFGAGDAKIRELAGSHKIIDSSKNLKTRYDTQKINVYESVTVETESTEFIGEPAEIREKTSKSLKSTPTSNGKLNFSMSSTNSNLTSIKANIINVGEQLYEYNNPESKQTSSVVEENENKKKEQAIKEKEDKEQSFRYKEKNFVTLLLSHSKARIYILNVTSWLFEIMESNEKTVEMIDLTKYLLYKVTDSDRWGITEFDFSIFDSENFSNVDGIYGNTIEEKVWYSLRKAGFSEESTAGVMGNIYKESNFKADAIEGGYNETNGGIGLVQWTDWPRSSGTGNSTNLRNFAKSKGKEWKDEDVQIEFLISQVKDNKAIGEVGLKDCTWTAWYNAKTPEAAAYQFEWWFEKHGGDTEPERATKAKEYYNMFHGKSLDSFGSGSTSASGNYTAKKDSSGRVVSLEWNGSPEYIQWKGHCTECDTWANKYYNNCVLCSTSIAIETITGKKCTPLQVCDYAVSKNLWQNGSPANNEVVKALTQHWGLKYSTVSSLSDVEKALKQGKIVIATVNASPWWTGGAHAICLMGYKNGQTFIRDPNSPSGHPSGRPGSVWYNLTDIWKYRAIFNSTYPWAVVYK